MVLGAIDCLTSSWGAQSGSTDPLAGRGWRWRAAADQLSVLPAHVSKPRESYSNRLRMHHIHFPLPTNGTNGRRAKSTVQPILARYCPGIHEQQRLQHRVSDLGFFLSCPYVMSDCCPRSTCSATLPAVTLLTRMILERSPSSEILNSTFREISAVSKVTLQRCCHAHAALTFAEVYLIFSEYMQL